MQSYPNKNIEWSCKSSNYIYGYSRDRIDNIPVFEETIEDYQKEILRLNEENNRLKKDVEAYKSEVKELRAEIRNYNDPH